MLGRQTYDNYGQAFHEIYQSQLKPAEIFQRHPHLFASVDDVYRIKRNVLERLRRNANIRAFLPA